MEDTLISSNQYVLFIALHYLIFHSADVINWSINFMDDKKELIIITDRNL